MIQPLSEIQRLALAAMTDGNIGAVCVGTIYGIQHDGRYDAYAFPEDVRTGSATVTGDDIAFAVYTILTDD